MSAPRGPEPLTYQDTLRALGADIDGWGVRTIQMTVSPAGVRVIAPERVAERWYTWSELHTMTARRSRLRNQRPPATQPPPARWEVILRLAGRAMDRHPSGQFSVEATRGGVGQAATCRVDSPEGPVLTAEECVIQQVEIARRYWRRGRRG